KDTAAIAKQVIEAFEDYDYVVAPSGSCGGMIKDHYPALFAADSEWQRRAEDLSGRMHELTSFLVDVLKVQGVQTAPQDVKITYHDSCSGLRELGVKGQPRALLDSIGGLEIVEMQTPETCCGFGGTFCVKYGEVSTDIVSRKTADINATGADLLLAGDMGCLLNMAGKLKREGSAVQVRHVAEVLAGMTDLPAIGEEQK
ncbi:MAG: (Fe-S)-binding protein, partial [Ferrovibrio sp.]